MCQVTTKKRKKIAAELYTFDDEPDVFQAHDSTQYLSLLHTYLLALAIAGTSKAPMAPQDAESFGSHPGRYVIVPWDVLEAYYFRAIRIAQSLPEAVRAAWI